MSSLNTYLSVCWAKIMEVNGITFEKLLQEMGELGDV